MKVILPRLVGAQAHHNDLIDRAGEHFAGEVHVAAAISDPGQGGVQIQLAAIVTEILVAGKIEQQVAHGLVGHLLDGLGHHLLADQLIGARYSPAKISRRASGSAARALGLFGS